MLQLTAIGRLTKDPEIKKNNKGADFVVFDLAVNRGYGDNQTTTYVSCCAGGILVSPLSKAKKGSLISITGELSVELYQKRDGSTAANVKCLISSFNYIPTGNGQKNNQQNQNGNGYGNQQPQNNHPAPQYAPPGQYGAPQNYGTPEGYEEYNVSDGDLPF